VDVDSKSKATNSRDGMMLL